MADITHEQVIELVRTLPNDRLGSLYDFALYLKARRAPALVEDDLFGESAEEIRADEAWWDEQFGRSEEALLRIAEEATEAYRTGKTMPMEFADFSGMNPASA